MQYRKLGKTGIEASEIGFGTWGIGGGWGDLDDQGALRALDRAYEMGVTFYDTALAYGDGHSEGLIGKMMNNHRDNVVVATKVPPNNYQWPVRPDKPLSVAFPAYWIVESTERSLKNLNTDYIDLLQLHGWTPPYMQQLEWAEAVQRLKEAGKIRAFGVCANDWDPYGPVELIQSGLIDTVQVTYNIFEQRPEEALLPAALEQEVGIICRIPFEEGLLTGQLEPGYQFEPGDWREEWLTPDRLQQVAGRTMALGECLTPDKPTLPALALKFCLSHPAVSTVIPGMRKVAHVEANCAVSDGQLLTTSERKKLKQHVFSHGWSYPGGAGVE
jgi:aryl-alcohol dehydrogenase-like predicted oxidoreductase